MILTGEGTVKLVKVSPEELDGLTQGTDYEALGDGVLVVDTDQLENSGSEHAEAVLKIVGEDFQGFVHLQC